MLLGDQQLLAQVLRFGEIDQLGMTRKRDVLVLKLAGGMLREVNRKCICYVQSSHAAVRIYIAGHTAAAVRYDNGVPVAVYRIRQSLPKLLECFVVRID